MLNQAPETSLGMEDHSKFHQIGQGAGFGRLLQIWNLLEKIQPDLVFMKLMGEPSAVASQWCRYRHRGFIYRAANKRDLDLAAGSRRYGWRQSFCFRLTCHDKMLIIAQTREQLEVYRNRFGNTRVRQIRNYYYNNNQDIELPTFDKRNGVLWVGHISEVKRPQLVLELARRLPDIPFTVIANSGSGTFVNKWESEKNSVPNISYIKGMSLQDTERQFLSARLHLNTSRSEGFPNTFLQAIYAGVPLVTTGIDPDGLIDQNGLGFRSANLDVLSKWLAETYAERRSWEALANQVTLFSKNEMQMGRYIDFYERALQKAVDLAMD
jgi:glycosyltransferase involved in cell wall biosynthesis